jgi:CheY-like chemotaxis protein
MQLNQRCRILAVDDTAASLYLLKTALEEEGYDVDTANISENSQILRLVRRK